MKKILEIVEADIKRRYEILETLKASLQESEYEVNKAQSRVFEATKEISDIESQLSELKQFHQQPEY